MANQSLFGQRDSGAQERFKFPIAERLKICAQSASSIPSGCLPEKRAHVYCFAGYFL
jgi:hypothetical protein